MTIPGTGETVGEAYIRIIADGSRLPRSIREEWRKNDPVVRGEGKRQGSLYADEFDKAMKDRIDKDSKNGRLFGSRDSMRRGIQRALAKGDITSAFFDSDGWKEFRRQLETRFGEAGRRAGRNLADGLGQSGDFKAFDQRLKNILGEVHRATREIHDEEQRALVAANRSYKKRVQLVQGLERELAKLTRPRHDMFGAKDTERLEKHFAKLIGQIKDEGTSAESAGRKMRLLLRAEEEMKKVNDDLESGFSRLDRRLRGIGRDTNIFRNGIRDVGDLERRLSNIDKRVKNLKIGRFFGEGSRNDFFNILGKITGKLAEFTILAGVRAARAAIGFGSGLRQANGIMGKTTFLMRTLEGVVGKVVKVVLGAGVALGALQLIGGPIAALISTLAGVVTALASSIAIGLIGAIGAALPIMGVFAASVGVIGLAFAKGGKTYDKWKKDMSKALGPVTSQFHQLQDAAREGLFTGLNKGAPLLAKTLDRITPLIRKVGAALGTAFDNFLQNLQGPQFKKNLDSMEKFFPQAIEKLGRVATNVFGGIAGLMRALVPIADKLIDSWIKGTRQFRAFTNSTEGQNTLRDWFDHAYKSGQRLWRFTKDLIRVLFDLFNLGNRTGDNIFDSMSRSLETFDKWLRSDKGAAATRKWFEQSRDMLTHLGNFVAGVAHLFGRLSAGGTGPLNTIFDSLGKFADLLAAALPTIQQFLHDVGSFLGAFVRGLTNVFNFLNAHPDLMRPLVETLAGLWAAWKIFTIGSAIGGGFAKITGAFILGFANLGAVLRTGTSQLTTAKEKLAGAAAGLSIALAGITAGSQVSGGGGAAIGIGGGLVGGAITGAAVGGAPGAAIGAVIGGVAGAIAHFWGESSRAAEAARDRQIAVINDIKRAADELRGTLAEDANSIRQLTKTQIANDFNRVKPGQTKSAFEAAFNLGIDSKTLIKATTSQKTMAALLSELDLRGKELGGQRTAFLASHSHIAQLIGTGSLKEDQVPELHKISEQADSILALKDALNAEGTALKSSIRQSDEIAHATGRLNLATRDAATQFLAYGKRINGASLAAQRNREFIHDHITAITKDAEKMLAAKKPAGDVAKAYLDQAEGLAKTLRQAGFMGPAVDKLIAKYAAVPKDLVTKLAADPTDANKKIAEELFKIGILNKGALIKIVGKDEASGVINSVSSDLKNKLPKVKQIPITVIKAPGFDFDLQKLVNSVTNTTAFIHVGVDRVGPGTTRGVGAAGRILSRATRLLGGEAGPEALVPLNRPLSQVDPSVRWLSAIAQGLSPDARDVKMARGGTVNPATQRVVNIEAGAIQVITPTTDPAAVATEAVNVIALRVNG